MQDPDERDKLLRSISPAVRKARKERGMTQEQVAERMSLTTEFVARIERGQSMPSMESLVNLALVLDVSVDTLLGTADIEPPLGPFADLPPELTDLAERITQLNKLGRLAVAAVIRAAEAPGPDDLEGEPP